MKLSKDGETDKIRKEGKERAAVILESFPQFKKGAPASPASPVQPGTPRTETDSGPGGN